MNNDLISRSALLKEGIRGKYLVGADGSILIPVHCVRKYIKEAPAVDSVIPVRCKDCKYHNKPPCPMRLSFNWTEDDDFCSYGERKEGAD